MKILALVTILAVSAIAGEKNRPWQTGTVWDAERTRELKGFRGSSSSSGEVRVNKQGSGTYDGTSSHRDTAVYSTVQNLVITTETHAYMIQQRPTIRRPASVSVNGKVKFAVEANTLFLIDDNGKEYKFQILKKILLKN